MTIAATKKPTTKKVAARKPATKKSTVKKPAVKKDAGPAKKATPKFKVKRTPNAVFKKPLMPSGPLAAVVGAKRLEAF